MPTEHRTVRNRQSPGGVLTCDKCGSIVSRRKYNNALKFGVQPGCPKCGSTDMTADRPFTIRNRRLDWGPRTKTVKRVTSVGKSGVPGRGAR